MELAFALSDFGNLSTGHRDAVKRAPFGEGDLCRRSDPARAFEGQ
jgi:hypothetical protein